VFARLARFTIARRRLVLVAGTVAFAASGALGGGVASELSHGGFDDPGSESYRADAALLETFGTATPNLVVLVGADSGDVDDPGATMAGRGVIDRLGADPTIAEVVGYWGLPPGNPLRSDDGASALVLARIAGSDDDVNARIGELGPELRASPGPVEVQVGGFAEVFHEVGETIEADLVRAELIALPITVVLLLVVFRSAVAAALPLLVGGLSIVSTFVALRVVNGFTEVSIFSLNLTTALGLGLAIDYSLFVVSRYREELGRGHEPHEAVARTVQTAGRTVAFSALTVGVSLSALLIFPIAFLRSFAYAGMAVAILAGLWSVVLLPAVLALLGYRIDALALRRRRPAADRAERAETDGAWYRVATAVMRRPVPVATGVIAVLVVLGLPFLRIELGLPDDRVLPPSSDVRQVMDAIREDFSGGDAGALSVVAVGTGDPGARAGEIDAYAASLSGLPGVSRVDAVTGIYAGGAQVVPADDLLAGRFGAADGTFLSVVPTVEPLSAEGEALVAAVRAAPAPFDVAVTGPGAMLVDAKSALLGLLPWALLIIGGVTFVLLFVMFGSVVIPAKAIVLNVLSLSATFGAMVWIFQDGNLAGFFDITPTGSIAATMPILMFCVAFGLSMDYEVFLLSRIKEEHDRTGDNEASVALGLERTGRIVTAAAVLIAVVFLAFSTSSVSFIKLFGLGLALAVLLDAFVIRGTLVPAFMRLAGGVNWWAPAPLRRLHDRIGVSEHVDLDGGPGPAVVPVAAVAEVPAVTSARRDRPLVAAAAEDRS
jgi:putative drug exporter of the RND superfamily